MDAEQQITTNEDPIAFQTDAISPLNECQTKEARRMCVFDMAYKCNGQKYEIGGTYTDDKPDLRFYYTVTSGLYHCHILNIFAFHQSVGKFVIGISNNKNLSTKYPNGSDCDSYVFLPNKLQWKTFRTLVPDESHHIRSYCFSRDDLQIISNKGLCIYIEINMSPESPVNVEVMQRIKLNCDITKTLKQNKNFTLISVSGKKYEVNKIILLAHSPVLREMVKDSKSNTLALDIDDSKMDILLEYLYTGTIENITLQDYDLIFSITELYQLENLKLIEKTISEQINTDNAIQFVVLSDKYKLGDLENKCFAFIKENPAVLNGDAWKNLKDLELAKKIFKKLAFIQSV